VIRASGGVTWDEMRVKAAVLTQEG
jgi:hypothetical protein